MSKRRNINSQYCSTKVYDYEDQKKLDIGNKFDRQALYQQNHIPEIYRPMMVDSRVWAARNKVKDQEEFEKRKSEKYQELK